MEFYSTSASLIAILMLAFTIEGRSTKFRGKINEKVFHIVSSQNQLGVFFWGSLGIVACLYKLSGLNLLDGSGGGMVAVSTSVITLLIYFLLQIIIKNSEENKKFLGIVIAYFALMTIPFVIGLVMIISRNYLLDGLVIFITSLIVTITSGKNVTWNKDLRQFSKLGKKS